MKITPEELEQLKFIMRQVTEANEIFKAAQDQWNIANGGAVLFQKYMMDKYKLNSNNLSVDFETGEIKDANNVLFKDST